jgi:peroxiredoxin
MLRGAAVFAFALMSAACASAPAAAPPALQESAPPERSDPRPISYSRLGQQIPAFSAPLVGGGVLTDQSLRGKWAVIEFWGLSCAPCVADATHAAALSSAIAQDPGLRFVTIHSDSSFGRWRSMQAFLREQGYAYPIALDADRAIYNAFAIQWAPTYLVIDPNGIVRGFRTDLNLDRDPDGGVKGFIKEIAHLRGASG